MIRKLEINELDVVMKIWLETNVNAHSFINQSYWHENYESVKKILPNSTVFVYEQNDVILGFIGLSKNYIAGIFVVGGNQSKGIGKSLLDYAKKGYGTLSLQVYKKNIRAIEFYLREGFVITKEQIDENTGEIELLMNWNA